MLSVAQAQAIVLDHCRPLPPEPMLLFAGAVGQVLAVDVASDLDMPPFDKALMDGYAVRIADLSGGAGTLEIIEEITAGQVPKKTLEAGQASRIMTGAPIPQGADAVVMVERTQTEGSRVRIADPGLKPHQNILDRGKEMREGEVVLKKGLVLGPQEMGLLASVGRHKAILHPVPIVSILPTGDEIVEAQKKPAAGQIRNGNGPMLAAQVRRAGCVPAPLGIARDTLDSLRPLIKRGLQSHVLVLSGGVSAGKLDLVPGVLQELGVEAHFHKVEMKPGKPVFFGTTKSALVFGLPGNPVSSLVCFELFVRPAIRKLKGLADPGPRMAQARLVEDYSYRSDRPTYHPARAELADDGWQVRALPWFGSPDLRGLLGANALVVLPPGDHRHRQGDRFPVLLTE